MENPLTTLLWFLLSGFEIWLSWAFLCLIDYGEDTGMSVRGTLPQWTLPQWTLPQGTFPQGTAELSAAEANLQKCSLRKCHSAEVLSSLSFSSAHANEPCFILKWCFLAFAQSYNSK